MSKRHLAAAAAVVALLGFTGAAMAQSPVDTQYGGGGVGGSGGEGAPSSGNLPFTGVDLGFVALGGAGLAALGVVLRRSARAKRH